MVSWDRETIDALRGAVYRDDGATVVEVVSGRPMDDVLQMAGDGPRYYQLSNERQRGRARSWLAGEGYRPTGSRL